MAIESSSSLEADLKKLEDWKVMAEGKLVRAELESRVITAQQHRELNPDHPVQDVEVVWHFTESRAIAGAEEMRELGMNNARDHFHQGLRGVKYTEMMWPAVLGPVLDDVARAVQPKLDGIEKLYAIAKAELASKHTRIERRISRLNSGRRARRRPRTTNQDTAIPVKLATIRHYNEPRRSA